MGWAQDDENSGQLGAQMGWGCVCQGNKQGRAAKDRLADLHSVSKMKQQSFLMVKVLIYFWWAGKGRRCGDINNELRNTISFIDLTIYLFLTYFLSFFIYFFIY
jgi:hypothetical protein